VSIDDIYLTLVLSGASGGIVPTALHQQQSDQKWNLRQTDHGLRFIGLNGGRAASTISKSRQQTRSGRLML